VITKNRCCIVLLAGLSLMICLQTSQAIPPAPSAVSGKEYSHFIDEDSTGIPDFEQAIFWDGLGGAIDTFDYSGTPRMPTISVIKPETDAIAFDNDFLFQRLRDNTADLIFSTDMDGSMYFEDTAAVAMGGVWAAPPMINMMAPPRDVDAIELWGPNSSAAASGDDGYNYSLESRPPFGPGAIDPGFVPVWHIPGSTPGALGPAAFPLFSTADLVAAIFPLAPVGTPIDLLQEELDLDGMMLDIQEFEEAIPGGPPGVSVGRINFTIDPITDPNGLVVFDGGEIFTWDFALPGPIAPAAFLFHGGHLWDTAFPVMATYGTLSENVNGIEAVPEPATGLLLAVGMLFLGRRRRC
jgi:hypothetical protein